jgi:hypothetical protein
MQHLEPLGAIWMFLHDYNRQVRKKLAEREDPIFFSVLYSKAPPNGTLGQGYFILAEVLIC